MNFSLYIDKLLTPDLIDGVVNTLIIEASHKNKKVYNIKKIFTILSHKGYFIIKQTLVIIELIYIYLPTGKFYTRNIVYRNSTFYIAMAYTYIILYYH